jgi:hypothetical protein
MDKNYGGVIWTAHALSRMREREISQGDAWATWRRPDTSSYAKQKGAWVYHRTWGDQMIEVVATRNKKGDWVVLSVWSRPVIHRQKRPKTNPFSQIIKKLFLQTASKH